MSMEANSNVAAPLKREEWDFSTLAEGGFALLHKERLRRFASKKRHPAEAGRRAGDAITGGVTAGFYNPASMQSSTNLRRLQLH